MEIYEFKPKKGFQFTPEEILKMDIPKMPETAEEYRQKFPISSRVDRLYGHYMKTKDESIKPQIVELIQQLEKRYQEVSGGDDWLTIEVFPGAKAFYGTFIGTPKEFELLRQHDHYFTRFMQLEGRL